MMMMMMMMMGAYLPFTGPELTGDWLDYTIWPAWCHTYG